MENNQGWEGKLDEIVRDFTSVGSMPKSEARRRFGEILAAELKIAREEMKLTLGCTCKNIAPASVHFNDCPLGNAIVNSKSLATYRKELVEAINQIPRSSAAWEIRARILTLLSAQEDNNKS